jgi:hypothetical protein
MLKMGDESDSDGDEGVLEDTDEEQDNSAEQNSFLQGTPSSVTFSSTAYRKGFKGQLTRTRVAPKVNVSSVDKLNKILGSEVEGRAIVTKYNYFNAGM